MNITDKRVNNAGGGAGRAQMIALNRENPCAVDDRFLGLKPALAEAVKDHSAL